MFACFALQRHTSPSGEVGLRCEERLQHVLLIFSLPSHTRFTMTFKGDLRIQCHSPPVWPGDLTDEANDAERYVTRWMETDTAKWRS